MEKITHSGKRVSRISVRSRRVRLQLSQGVVFVVLLCLVGLLCRALLLDSASSSSSVSLHNFKYAKQ